MSTFPPGCNLDNSCSVKDSLQNILKCFKKTENASPNDTIAPHLGYGASSGTQADIWDVAKLPARVQPVSKPSKRLDKFLQDKEVSHYKAVEKMRAQSTRVNFDFEESYRQSAELLKRLLRDEHGKVEEVLDEVLLEPKNTIVFGAIEYKDVPSAICLYDKCCQDAIQKFYDTVLCLEKERCDKYKNIYKGSYAEAGDISHLMPFEVQQFFEFEITKFNEILLQNYRCYAEVDMILKSEIEQNKTMWFQKLNRNKAKWVDFFKARGFDTSAMEEVSEVDVGSMMDIVSSAVTNRYKEIAATINELDEFVNDALRKCKFVLLKIYYGEYNELHKMNDAFSIPSDAFSRDQLLQFKSELKELMEKVEAENLLQNELDQENFIAVIDVLRGRVESTESFFKNISRLWDAHYRRSAELYDTVASHLKQSREAQNVLIEGTEIHFNIYFDMCRSASTVDELQKNFGYIVAAMNKCNKQNMEEKQKEYNILDKFLEMVATESAVLMAEMHRFLVVYRPIYDYPIPLETQPSVTIISDEEDKEERDEVFRDDISMADNKSRTSSFYVVFPNRSSSDNLPPHIKYIKFRITSLDNWKYGIWETVESKMRECKEEMLKNAKAWADSHRDEIERLCQEKLDMNKIKYYRIWLSVYYMRYIELHRHTQRLEQHLKGIDKVTEAFAEIPKAASKEVSLLADETARDANNLENEIKTAKSIGFVKSVNMKMQVLQDDFQKKVDVLKENFNMDKVKYEHIVQWANVDYLKSIKMFSESGNFHVDEVKNITAELQRAEKHFLKKAESCEKDFFTHIPKVAIKVSAAERSVYNLSDIMQNEFTFLDNIRECMNHLQTEIKRIAYNLKHKRKIVQALVDQEQATAAKLRGSNKPEAIQSFAGKCYDVIQNFEELYFLLKRNEEYDILSEARKKPSGTHVNHTKTGRSVTSVVNVASAAEKEKRSHTNVNECKSPIKSGSWSHTRGNPSEQHLDEKVGSQNSSQSLIVDMSDSFNDSVVTLVRDKMEQMRSIAQSFYTTVKSIMNKDQIEATFEEFSGHSIAKCGYFLIQCDAMWLEEAIEYTRLTATFRNGLLKMYNNFMNHCMEYKNAKYENRYATIIEILNDSEAIAISEIKQVHKRLKTLHGFPKNKALLEALHEEFIEKLKRYDTSIDSNIGNFKESHIKLKEFIMDKLTSFDDILTQLILSERLKNLNGDMFVQILNLFTQLQTLKKRKDCQVLPEVQSRDTAITKIASEKFSVYKSSLIVIPIPEEYITRFSVSTMSPSVDSISNTFNFDDNSIEAADLAEFSKKLDDILDNHLEGIDRFVMKVASDIEKWEKIWDNDVEIIKKLYTVKYTIPSDVPERINNN